MQYAINFHPAPLPRARGAYPLPAAILEQSPTWGVTCHKVEHEFDSGDILKALEFPLSPTDDHDSLDLRTQLASRQLAGEVAEHCVEYWNAATAIVVAAADGYIGLTQWNLINADTVTGTVHR